MRMAEPLPEFWSFNRTRDASLIQTEDLVWQGPFSWPGFEQRNNLVPIPDIAGVYLFTFEHRDGYILCSAGNTNSMKRRLSQHKRNYMSGKYTILDVEAAKKGERKEIWHGWSYAKKHHEQFLQHKDYILGLAKHQLASYRLFATEVNDKRKQERIEFAIVQHAYLSKEPWGDLVDGQMALRGRANYDVPIEAKNICPHKIYGVPNTLEI